MDLVTKLPIDEIQPDRLPEPSLVCLPFLALCVYILSHAFAIPVLALGSSWAIWPTLADLALVLLVASSLFDNCAIGPSMAQSKLFLFMGAAFLACLLSLQLSLIYFMPGSESKRVITGAYQFVRLVEVLAVFWATSRIWLTPARTAALRRVAGFTLLLACGGVFATYFYILPPEVLTMHLPSDLNTSGPWYFYSLGEPARGWGALGYNRGAVAVQVLLLLALYLRLASEHGNVVQLSSIALATFAVFLSGSRAGFAAMLCFIGLTARPREAVLFLIATVALASVFLQSFQSYEDSVSLADGYGALLNPTNESSLNGRSGLWEEHLASIGINPLLLFIGAGFGSVADLVDNAHCLPLQVLLELGAIGLIVWFGLVAHILVSLYQVEGGTRVIFFATAALLFSSLTQETFYPIPAMGRFLDLYCCCLALVLSGKLPN